MPFKEIAQFLEIKESTAKTAHFRAIKKFKTVFFDRKL